MDKLSVLKNHLHVLVHSKSKSKKGETLYEIADHVGKTSGYISQIADLNRENPFPIEIALKTMQLKKQYNVIKYMATELNGVFVKLPKFKLTKKDEQEISANYQKVAAAAVSSFIKFLFEPNVETFKECEENLSKMIEASVSARMYVKKIASNQMELFK